MVVLVEVEVDEDDDEDGELFAIFLLPDTPYTILSIPIIKRLIGSINVKRNIPNNGFAKTSIAMPIENIPAATWNSATT